MIRFGSTVPQDPEDVKRHLEGISARPPVGRGKIPVNPVTDASASTKNLNRFRNRHTPVLVDMNKAFKIKDSFGLGRVNPVYKAKNQKKNSCANESEKRAAFHGTSFFFSAKKYAGET
jgi:hypothetical protein